jgi:uncharacterized protein DUF5329
MTKSKKTIATLMIGFISLTSVYASSVDQETQHLLSYIGNSGCTFIRNGTEYSPEKARAHIRRKYNYVKNKITTTEQVIKYAATESSLSGKIYFIKCPGIAKEPSAEWLTKELIKFRTE